MPNEIETGQQLIRLVKGISLSRLKILSNRSEILSADIVKESLVYGHWMALILASGRDLRLTLKIHYMTKVAKFFAAKAYSTAATELSQLRAMDFCRELCNLSGGNLKVLLAQNNVKVGVSLPVVTRGFDDLYYSRSEDTIFSHWRLSCEGYSIDCTANVEVLAPFQLIQLADGGESDSGDVDFL